VHGLDDPSKDCRAAIDNSPSLGSPLQDPASEATGYPFPPMAASISPPSFMSFWAPSQWTSLRAGVSPFRLLGHSFSFSVELGWLYSRGGAFADFLFFLLTLS